MKEKQIGPAWLGPALVIGAGVLWGFTGLFVRYLSAAGLDSMQLAANRAIVTSAALSRIASRCSGIAAAQRTRAAYAPASASSMSASPAR